MFDYGAVQKFQSLKVKVNRSLHSEHVQRVLTMFVLPRPARTCIHHIMQPWSLAQMTFWDMHDDIFIVLKRQSRRNRESKFRHALSESLIQSYEMTVTDGSLTGRRASQLGGWASYFWGWAGHFGGWTGSLWRRRAHSRWRACVTAHHSAIDNVQLTYPHVNS